MKHAVVLQVSTAPLRSWILEHAVIIAQHTALRLTLSGPCDCCVGIQEMLERVAKEKGLVWEEFFGKLKHNNQWHVEVY